MEGEMKEDIEIALLKPTVSEKIIVGESEMKKLI